MIYLTPCRAWRLAQIKELIFSRDGLIRLAKIQLPDNNIISGAIISLEDNPADYSSRC